MNLQYLPLDCPETENEVTKEVGGYDHVFVLQNIKVVDGDIVETLKKLPRGTFPGDCILNIFVYILYILKTTITVLLLALELSPGPTL